MSVNDKLFIDHNQCINCGLCVITCPAQIFVMCNNNVNINKQNESFCINCGDCVSACPREAIKNTDVFTENLHEAYINLKPEQLLNFFRVRRTVRSYKKNALSTDEKEYLAQIASVVPRGGHTPSVRDTGIVIVENMELVEKITEYTYEYLYELKKKLSSIWISIPKRFNQTFRASINSTIERIDLVLKAKEQKVNMITYNSPTLILLHSEKNSPISQENLTIMEYQLMLGAETLNLGTCFLGWVSFAMQSFRIRKSNNLKKIYEMLKIPADREIYSVFSIGQKNTKYRKLKSRKNISLLTI